MDKSLEKLQEKNLIQARDMCDRFVSPGLYSLESLGDIASDPLHDFYLVRGPEGYLGYFYAQRLKALDIASVPGFSYGKIASLCPPEEAIGLFRSTGLEEAWRHTGLSDDLMDHFQSLYREAYGISLIIVAAWKQGAFVPAEKLLLRSGFQYFGDLSKPWFDQTGLQCFYCQKNRCICDAAVYYKRRGQ